MPEVTALKSFKGRYGHIRNGQIFNADPNYTAQLLRNRLVKLTNKDPGPSEDRDRKEAPHRGGKDKPGKGNPVLPTDLQPSADGKVLTSASLPADPASLKKTSPRSAGGGRRGSPTPRKGKAKTTSTPPEQTGE